MGYSIVKLDSDYKEIAKSKLKKQSKKYVTLIESDMLTTPPEMDMHMRLRVLYNGLTAIVKKHSPEVMVIEKLFFNTNVKTAMTVGQARGVSLLVAANKRMQVYEYTSLEAKLVLTGYGRSDKKEVQKAVKEILHLDEIIKSDDANDAVAMVLCHLKKGVIPDFSV